MLPNKQLKSVPLHGLHIASRNTTLLITLAVVAIAALILGLRSSSPEMFPDSAGYIAFNPGRTAPYPLFIDLVGLDRIVLVQTLLFCAAAGFLGWSFARLTGWPPLGAALVLVLGMNPAVSAFHGQVLTESLFLTLLCLHVGLVLMFLRRRSLGMLVLAALVAGLAGALRPNAVPIGLCPLLLILLAPRLGFVPILGRASVLLAVWLVPLVGFNLYERQIHGAEKTSLLGPHIYAKSALIEARPVDPAGRDDLHRNLFRRAEQDYQAVRTFLATARETTAYPTLLSYYEECIQHACTRPIAPPSRVPEAEYYQAMLEVGRERIASNPLAYLSLSLDEFLGFWLVNSRNHPRLAERYDTFVKSRSGLPFRSYLGENVDQPSQPSMIAWVSRPLFAVSGIAMTLAALVLFAFLIARKGAAELHGAFYVAVAGLAISVFTALFGIGIPRYTLSIWPLISCFWLLIAATLLSALKRVRG